MSCCGGHRASPRTETPTSIPIRREHVLYEYLGTGPLTLYGPITGARYHFAGAGARVLVDGRDAGTLAMVAHLKPIR
ncbi:MAG: hypothetical protein R3E10_06745 [Gemmatimonadota bacterium]